MKTLFKNFNCYLTIKNPQGWNLMWGFWQCCNDNFQYIIKNEKKKFNYSWVLIDHTCAILINHMRSVSLLQAISQFQRLFPGIVGRSRPKPLWDTNDLGNAGKSWEYETWALWHVGSEHLIQYIYKSFYRTVSFHYDMRTNTPINMTDLCSSQFGN